MKVVPDPLLGVDQAEVDPGLVLNGLQRDQDTLPRAVLVLAELHLQNGSVSAES